MPKAVGVQVDKTAIGFTPIQKPSPDLLQNCDLPPPLKLLHPAGADMAAVRSPMMNTKCSLIGQEDEEGRLHISKTISSEGDKLELLKALRLSQTRARDAERRSAILKEERDCLSKLFLQESFELLAYKQWVRLLELQLSILHSRQQQEPPQSEAAGGEDNNKEDASSVTLFIAMAVCLGVGMGCAVRWGFAIL